MNALRPRHIAFEDAFETKEILLIWHVALHNVYVGALYLWFALARACLCSRISAFMSMKKFVYSLVAIIVSIKKRLVPNTSPLSRISLHWS